ncbi:MAG: PIN domain-containing protein [Synechococcaceae cyanobacterium SM2_3_2]|nr:PIN domain-containing protein [Synechococcaceae cyanobacterium SM2_3_2]
MILLSDANILIDLAYVNGLAVLTQLANVEVLDVVFDECQYPEGIQTNILAVGIKQVTTQSAWLQLSQSYRQGPLSQQDALCCYYAKTFDRMLLTNEKPLRTRCQREGIPYHGILWVIREAHSKQLASNPTLCEWLHILQTQGSRMPKQELLDLRTILGC